jgi:uncharacterized protein
MPINKPYVGLGYRDKMQYFDWTLNSKLCKILNFIEIAPENWIHKDRSILHKLAENFSCPIRLHGLGLNLGGYNTISTVFLQQIKDFIHEFNVEYYSDHLASCGDQYFLYDLFPIPFNRQEAKRVADRICMVQEYLGRQIAIENSSYYTNIEDMNEVDFLNEVVKLAGCKILLDINNIVVNYKNHKLIQPADFISNINFNNVTYMHVAGHVYSKEFNMHIDTHSCKVDHNTMELATSISQTYGKDILLEWDNDIPSQSTITREIVCIKQMMSSNSLA